MHLTHNVDGSWLAQCTRCDNQAVLDDKLRTKHEAIKEAERFGMYLVGGCRECLSPEMQGALNGKRTVE